MPTIGPRRDRHDARGGDGFAWEFRTHFRLVESFVQTHYPGVDSDEVLSRTFEVAWRRIDAVPPAARRAWLIGVARNCARNQIRAERRYRDHLNPVAVELAAELVEPAAILPSTIAVLRHAWARLSAEDRELLLLAEWEGFSIDEIALILEIRPGTAQVRLHRARVRFRQAFVEGGDR